MSTPAALGLAALLLALNFGFVAAEFALISARRTRIEPRAMQGSRAARTTLGALEHVSDMLAGAQLGITACTLGLGAVGEPAVAHLLEPLFTLLGLPAVAVYPVSFGLALALVVTLHVVLGEMVPKNLVLAGPERAALLLGPPLVAIVWILRPFIWLLNVSANGCLRLMRIEPRREVATTFTREEVSGLIDESRRGGLIEDDSYQLVAGALTFTEGTVERVLLPTAALRAVRSDSTLAEVEALCAETGFSRFPVTRARSAEHPADATDVIGYLHIKDVLETDPERSSRPISAKWIRPMASLRRTSSLRDALRIMQRRGSHLARVVNDDGTLIGVVALEDVLEELVGEVRDAAQHIKTNRS
ncbi:hemolysin family protein [Microlunatus panaciterrae]|uniref:CBS domain containing-hemolysin-like protein n=1 Tax=Microlunatus panaciterrae TaxID=400768 RepID=A0ABS2RJQ6_9ACTN|nr:hemolysin family protein [Microlunatus panaciterrae]MBM7799244.1 CBS domain containing-hemolysin-like protein [Microlunatus panaciterrae]